MTARTGAARWRIVTPHGKFVYLFLLVTLLVPAGFVAASATMGSWAGALSAVPLLLIGTGFAVRNYRDAEIESLEAPRAWWCMTARPVSGFVVGALFVAQAVWATLTALQKPDGWALVLGAVTEGLLGVAFLRSSMRLRAEETRLSEV